MKYDLSNDNESLIAYNQFNHLRLNKRLIELSEIKKTRSNLQNRALHLFFDIISTELNNLGLEFIYTGIKGVDLNTTYTQRIVKDFIWRPIQISLFGKESTKDLNTQQLNDISEIIIKFFAEKGIRINFPNIKDEFENL